MNYALHWDAIVRYPEGRNIRAKPEKVVSLWDFMCENPSDYDVYDEEFVDIDPITICSPDLYDQNEDYDKFIIELCKKVALTDRGHDGVSICAGWCCLIRRNEKLLRDFMQRYWKYRYQSKRKFTAAWIHELRHYVTGNVPEEFYGTLLELARKLK